MAIDLDEFVEQVEVHYVVSVVRLTQELVERDDFKKFTAELVAQIEATDGKKVLLDLEHVQYLNSETLGHLAVLNKRLADIGAELRLYNLNPAVDQVFETSQLNRMIGIRPDQETALEGWCEFDAKAIQQRNMA